MVMTVNNDRIWHFIDSVFSLLMLFFLAILLFGIAKFVIGWILIEFLDKGYKILESGFNITTKSFICFSITFLYFILKER